MFVIVMALLLMGVVEVSVLAVVTSLLSWEATLLLLILTAAVGAWVVKREGTATWRRVMSGVRAGQLPTSSVLDGCLIVVAGVLLLLPGFVSDVMALALTLPPVRKLVRTRVSEHFQRRIAAQVSSRAGGATVFGFGTPSGFAGFGSESSSGFGGFGYRSTGRDEDIIDLDAEEVYLLDEPIAEIEPPRERPA